MQTYSHLILTAVLGKHVAHRNREDSRLPPFIAKAFLLGSILPDIPLILISIWAIATDLFTGVFTRVDFSTMTPGEPVPADIITVSRTMTLYEVWFFENPWVMAAQNLFHGPLLVALFIGIGYLAWRHGQRWAAGFFWLCCAAMLHTLIDIPLHTTDGPLVFFPFNWTYRFHSPISYWDPNYYGRQWSIFEHSLDFIALGYLIFSARQSIHSWWQRRHYRS